MVAPYIERHKNILCSENPGKTDSWIKGEHENTTIGDQLYLLARLPSSTICTFQGYEISGNTFYTISQDKKSTNQNSGVRFDATNNNGSKDTYYGYIEEIWELDYGPTFKVPVFRCKWVKLTAGGLKVDEQYGMITVGSVESLELTLVLAPTSREKAIGGTQKWPMRGAYWMRQYAPPMARH